MKEEIRFNGSLETDGSVSKFFARLVVKMGTKPNIPPFISNLLLLPRSHPKNLECQTENSFTCCIGYDCLEVPSSYLSLQEVIVSNDTSTRMPKHQRDKRKNRKGGGEPYESGEIPDQQKRGSGRHGKSKGRSRGGGGFASIHTPCTTFDEMNLKPDLLKGIYAYGFEKPSAIQQRAIKPIVQGRDVIAQSQSGTGKTAVFSIASLQLLDETSRDVQVLVLSPTRELAEQSQRVMQSLGDFMNVRNITTILEQGE